MKIISTDVVFKLTNAEIKALTRLLGNHSTNAYISHGLSHAQSELLDRMWRMLDNLPKGVNDDE